MRARLITIAFLLSCGGNGVDINTDQNNVCAEMAEVACHNIYQCCSESEIEDFLNVTDPRSEDECRTDVTRECARARSIALLDFGIDQKHVRFDSAIMNDCLESLLAPDDSCATIASVLPWTEACLNSAWIGLVEDGNPCLSTAECASKDSFCGASQTCVPRPRDGQPCGAGCASGLFCSAGTCRAQVGAGSACTSSLQCLEGLFCDLGAAPAVCSARRALGEACTNNAGCASNQCNPGTCAGTNNQACFANSGCGARCADDNSLCGADSDCGLGTCSGTTTPCLNQAACTTAGSTCVFPVRCNPGACLGDVVCGEGHLVVDYCEAAINELPIP